jgi:hypothetical protein
MSHAPAATNTRINRAFAAVLLCATGCVTSKPGQPLTRPVRQTITMKIPFKIGNTVVTAEVLQRGKPVPTMLNVHDDENTSVAAGQVIIEQTGGRLIALSHSGKRHVRFNLDGARYAFDPNRIFSDAGIRQTLAAEGQWSEPAQHAVKKFAAQYLEHFALDREPVILALHNTVDGTYSVRSYLPGAEHAAAAAKAHVCEQRSPFDFFYVTDPRFFDHLTQHNFNVILQDNAAVPDDGSLSVHFAQKGIPYLNIEAEMGHLNAQIDMVRAAREMLDEIGLLKAK